MGWIRKSSIICEHTFTSVLKTNSIFFIESNTFNHPIICNSKFQAKLTLQFVFSTSDRIYSDVLLLSKVRNLNKIGLNVRNRPQCTDRPQCTAV